MVAESPPDDAMLDMIVGIVMRGPQVIAIHGGRGLARQQGAWPFFLRGPSSATKNALLRARLRSALHPRFIRGLSAGEVCVVPCDDLNNAPGFWEA